MSIGNDGMWMAHQTSVHTRTSIDTICPFSDASENEDTIASRLWPDLSFDPVIGRFRNTFAGRLMASDEELSASSSGGLTTWLAKQLLIAGDVDGIIHVTPKHSDSHLFGYTISRTPDALDQGRKSAYYSVTLYDVLRQTTNDGLNYAVVGLPCFIRSVRLLVCHDERFRTQMRYFIGLVCGHMKSHLFAKSLGWQAGINPNELQQIDFRVKNRHARASDYSYSASGKNDRNPRVMSISSTVDGNWGYGAFQPNGCNFCDDIFAETADVTFGDAWLPEFVSDWRGTNLVVTRNSYLDSILQSARDRGEISLSPLNHNDVRNAQSGGIRHRREGLALRLFDDQSAGYLVPKKRVLPSSKFSHKRIVIIRLRRQLSKLSTDFFLDAVRNNNLDQYCRQIQSATSKYNHLYLRRGPIISTLRQLIRLARVISSAIRNRP